DLSSRVAAVSEAFLGTTYRLGPLGEGQDGEFDKDPLYSFKKVDCTTFVEQVMALALEPDLKKAVSGTLQRIRYKDGEIGYRTRNHFPETDWIPNNAKAGFIKDITEQVAGTRTKFAAKTISKKAWYAAKTFDDLQGLDLSQPDKGARLKTLQAAGKDLADEEASVPYVPASVLAEVVSRIPSGTIANIVREPRPDKPVVITHQGLIIDLGGRKFLRHAAYGRQVEDVPLLDYFVRYATASWRVAGVNLDAVRAGLQDSQLR
ncbi:MAG: DUF1460 domain-containing protein, partial [Elusimicrobia bacterium]|nr:DUF1460 domain-containing protein [Elusimicrobiota bacterium]